MKKNIILLSQKNYITIVLFAILVSIIWQPLITNNIPSKINQLKLDIANQKLINEKKALENKELSLKINILKDTNAQILESHARYNLGLIKHGERYYKIK